MKRPELKIDGGGYDGKVFAVDGSVVRLGRSSSNDIAVSDEELSRNHCLFEPSGDSGIRITDLASANGTYLNGKRLGSEAVELSVGDVITAGGTRVEVIGEEPPSPKPEVSVDLGLEGTGAEPTGRSSATAAPSPRRRFVNLLWIVALGVLAFAVWTIMDSSDEPDGQTAETQAVAEPAERLTEMSYEKVTGDSETIFRYALTLLDDGTLSVTIDDLTGNGRHFVRHATLRKDAIDRLQEIMSDPDFAALDSAYAGTMPDPPRLTSLQIGYFTTCNRKFVRIENADEPDAFRRVREKLEAFAANELNIRALEYSREQLVKMATAAADTGRMKWEDRDVENGNVYASLCAYREALSVLETVNPRPPEYETYREARERSEKELDERCKAQEFAVEQATAVGDWDKAKESLRTLCEIVPDRDDERHRRASTMLIDIEGRVKKGGRR